MHYEREPGPGIGLLGPVLVGGAALGALGSILGLIYGVTLIVRLL